MVKVRWLSASLFCHVLGLALWIVVQNVRPVAPPKLARKVRPPVSMRWVQPAALPAPVARPDPPARLALQQTRPAPRPRPTVAPRPRPVPTPTVRPRTASVPTPNPAATPDDPVAARLAQLGLTASAAAAITADVDAAIAASRGKLTPTTPTGSVAFWPEDWATGSGPVENFLSRLLPAQKGYEAELGVDPRTGSPEARIRYAAQANFVTGKAILVIARWPAGPNEGGVAEVSVQEWLPGLGLVPGGPATRFRMPLPPAGSDREAFLDGLAGFCMLGYQQALSGLDPMAASPP